MAPDRELSFGVLKLLHTLFLTLLYQVSVFVKHSELFVMLKRSSWLQFFF